MSKFFKYKRMYFTILIPISLVISYVARLDPFFTEKYFSRGYYPILSQTLSFITSLFPFSLAEFGLVFGVPSLIFYIIYCGYMEYKNPQIRKDIFLKLVSTLMVILSVGLFMFTTLCGVNYHRLPFTYYSNLTIEPSTKEELALLCEALINEANTLRASLTEDENGIMMLTDESIYKTAEKSKRIFDNVSNEYPVLKGNYPAPKPIMLSKGMSYAQITGVFVAYTCEANVNIHVPDYSIPSTMCHELNHLRGFMREDEANYISYLACTKSDDPEFKYSGVMLAVIHSMNKLYEYDYTAYEKLHYTYSAEVLRDLEDNSDYWRNFEGKFGDISDNINNTYLKANSQADGVQSYGRMVDLLIAQFKKNGYNTIP